MRNSFQFRIALFCEVIILLAKKGTETAKIDLIIKNLMGSILIIMTMVIFIQVIFRYLLNSSLSWTEELARFLQVALTFIGSAYAIRKGVHISLGDSLTRKLPNKIKLMIPYIIDTLILAFTITVFFQGMNILKIIKYQTSASMSIPMVYIYGLIPIGAVLSIIFIVLKYIKKN